MELEIRTLTPLWTGGVKGKVDRIHETGILGGLRWWYEVIVRGLGSNVCDPSQGKCAFDAEKYAKSTALAERQRLRDAGLCDVCQVFGATGWRRRFRLTIVDGTRQDTSSPKQISADRPVNPKTKRKPTWGFPDYPRDGNITIRVQNLAQDFAPEVIGGLVQFIANWAALGAKAQMGFGVIEQANGQIDTQPLFEWLELGASSNTYTDLPSLQNIFLARISPQNGGAFGTQDTFNLKYDLRQLFANDRNLRHFIMGTVKGKRMAAKIKMSRPYGDGLMRVWGWIPEQADVYGRSWNRESVVQAIYDHLNTNYTMQVWREMNSLRDTAASNNSDAQAFLRDLLAIEEEDNAA